MKKFQKILASVLAWTFIFTLAAVPTSSFADDTGSGSNTTDDSAIVDDVLDDDDDDTITYDGITVTDNDDETTVTTETTTVTDNDEETTVTQEADDEEIGEAEDNIDDSADSLDEATGDLESDDDGTVDNAIEAIEDEIEEISDELESAEDAGGNITQHKGVIAKIKTTLILAKKAHQNGNKVLLKLYVKRLKLLLAELRKAKIVRKVVRLVIRNIKIHNIQNQPFFSIRWGQVKRTASGSNTTGEGNWDGEITVSNGKIKLMKTILFESNDKIDSADTEKIEFTSNIINHFDGLLLKVFPNSNGSYDDTVVTVSFDDRDSLTFEKGDFADAPFQADIDENGVGVIIEKKRPGVIAASVLDNFRNHKTEFKAILENTDESQQDEVQGLLSEMDEDMQDDFISIHKKFGNKLGNLVNFLPFVPNEKRNEMLENKMEILSGVEDLEELMGNVNVSNMPVLQYVKGILEDFNFDPTTGVKVRNQIRIFVNQATANGATTEEIEAGIESLKADIENHKEDAKGNKYVQGLIPFKDTDDDQWFTKYVSFVKGKNIVGGYKDASGNELGEFRPSNNVTIAEILKMALETAELGGDTSGTPGNAQAVNHWAKKYFKKAEGLGLTMVGNQGIDPNSLATRGDVIRLTLEALGIQPSSVSQTDFSDVSGSDVNAAFIQYAKSAGVISGDTGKTTFRPNDPVNRAEVAKILQNMVEILKAAADVEE